jgi:hypothetical protein
VPPADVTRIAASQDWFVATFRNVMVLHVRRAPDEGFLQAAHEAHRALVASSDAGYGVAVLVERGTGLPSAHIRRRAVALRESTHAFLRAQVVLLAGDRFVDSAVRAVVSGISLLAGSRVPMRMVHSEDEAARFLAARMETRGSTGELASALRSVRASGLAG